jgi:hypothetical protein
MRPNRLATLQEPKKDYAAVRKAIENVLDAEDYDDGSYGEAAQQSSSTYNCMVCRTAPRWRSFEHW